jgi:hypothetical protein
MLSKMQCRSDQHINEDGHFKAIWSLKIPDANPRWDEYLVCLYDLTNLDASVPVVRYREDVTHEFVVVALAPEVRVDFSKNVFEQPTLIPLTPPNHAFQFKAESNEAAVSRIQVCVNSLLAGTLSPEDDPLGNWNMLFNDGVRLGP